MLVVISCDDVTCNPHNGDSELVIGSGGGMSALLLAEGMFVGCERRIDRLFLFNPNLAPIFFQLLPEIARCSPLGDVLNVKSDDGGVVGGVTGSTPGVEFGLLLSSVNKSASAASDAMMDDDRLCMLLRARVSKGRNVFLGECEFSSGDRSSLGILSRDLLCRTSRTSSADCCSAAAMVTDWQKGTRTESLISSWTIVTASLSSDGVGGFGRDWLRANKRSRTGAGKLTSREP